MLPTGSSDSACSERREFVGKSFSVELKQLLGPVEVFELVSTEVAEMSVGRKLVLDELARRIRDENLSAVSHRPDAGRPMDAEADIALAGGPRLSRVQAHSHAHPQVLGPGVAFERALRIDRARDGIAGTGEGDEERVSLHVDLPAAMCLEAVAEDALMVGEDLVVASPQLLEEPRGALDVSEEECDGAGRQVDHRSPFRGVSES